MWVVGGFCGSGGSVWVMGEWAVGQWIVGVTSFQKIYGLYSVEHHKVENIGNVEVMTEPSIHRISTCRLDPSGRRGRVKIKIV